MSMKYLALIQARCGSTRLPNKVLKDLCGKPQLQRVIERIQMSRWIDEAMVITSIEKVNLPILRLCAELDVRVGVGAEEDVLDRYYQTAKLIRPEYVIRITGDCPCIDPWLIDDAISQMPEDVDYCSNTLEPTFADGLDFEIIKFSALETAWRNARHSYEREHVTQYIIHHPEIFRQQNYKSPIGDFGNYRWTVDEPEDFEVVERIYQHFAVDLHTEIFGYRDILSFLKDHPEISKKNEKFQRNEGLQKSILEDTILNNTEAQT